MGNLGGAAAAGFNAIPFPGLTEPLQRAVLKKFGLVTGDAYNLPLGNPNLIREAKRRFTVSKDQAESGLGTTIEVKMEVEYEQKFFNRIQISLRSQNEDLKLIFLKELIKIIIKTYIKIFIRSHRSLGLFEFSLIHFKIIK